MMASPASTRTNPAKRGAVSRSPRREIAATYTITKVRMVKGYTRDKGIRDSAINQSTVPST